MSHSSNFATRGFVAFACSLLALNCAALGLTALAVQYYRHVQVTIQAGRSYIQVLVNHLQFGSTVSEFQGHTIQNLGWLSPGAVVTVVVTTWAEVPKKPTEAGDDRISLFIDGKSHKLTEEGFVSGDIGRPPASVVAICSVTAAYTMTGVGGACDPHCPKHCPALPRSWQSAAHSSISTTSQIFEDAFKIRTLLMIILVISGVGVMLWHDINITRKLRSDASAQTWTARAWLVLSAIVAGSAFLSVLGVEHALLVVEAVAGIVLIVAVLQSLDRVLTAAESLPSPPLSPGEAPS